MTIRKYDFVIKGLTPLLLHQDDVELSDDLTAWRKNPDNANLSTPGDDRTPPWSWKASCYTDGEVLTIPADNLMVSLRQAGATMMIPGRRGKTYKEVTQSGILIENPHMPILVGGEVIGYEDVNSISGTFREHVTAVRDLGFDLFVKRAKVGQSKHVRVRPRFNEWSIKGRLQVTADELTMDLIKRLFEIAGTSKGLCDWRPASPKSPGPYGRFETAISAA